MFFNLMLGGNFFLFLFDSLIIPNEQQIEFQYFYRWCDERNVLGLVWIEFSRSRQRKNVLQIRFTHEGKFRARW